VAAKKLVELMPEAYQGGRVTVDRVLDARRRLADAEDAYYRSLVSYSQQIAAVHYRKGSLLEYNNVYLSEGPWPGKAYFDARRHARARDAGLYVDYGYTRPKVISRGAYQQQVGGGVLVIEQGEGEPERIPTPAPEPLEVPAELPAPSGGLGQPMGPEPAALEPDASAADGVQIGPALGLREDAAAQPAVRQAGVDLAHGVSLLGSDKPAGEAAGGPSTGVGRWSAVKPTGGSEPVQQARMDDTGQAAAEAAPLKWSNLETLGSRHETHANSPAAEIDRAASGWEGVQR
jgi:hypothetical protein